MGVVSGNSNPIGTISDSSWVTRSFMLSGEGIYAAKENVERWRRFSSADLKFVGTGLGENTVLNSPAQFTPLADIPRQGLWKREGEFKITPIPRGGKQPTFTYGMGRCYAESIDDNKQVVHLRFGTVTYKGLVTFFTSFYDTESSNLARYGRASISYYFGLAIGTIATLPLAPVILAGKVWNYLVGRSSSRYMDLKPNMPLFWSRVNVIYNMLGANLGIIARTYQNEGFDEKVKDAFFERNRGNPAVEDLESETQTFKSYKEFMMHAPELQGMFKNSGAIDFFKVARMAARREIEVERKIHERAISQSTMRGTRDAILAFIDSPDDITAGERDISLEKYLTDFFKSVLGSISEIMLEIGGVEDKVTSAVNAMMDNSDPDALNKLATARQSSNQEQSVSGETSSDQAAVDSFVGNSSILPNSMGLSYGGMDLGLPSTPGTVSNAPRSLNGNGTAATKQPANPTATSTAEVDQVSGLPIGAPVEGEVPAFDNSELNQVKREAEFKSTAKVTESNGQSYWDLVTGWFSQAGSFFDTEWNQGGTFLNLAVQYTGSSTISFSNSLKDTMIQGTFNGASASGRDARVSLADYQTGFDFIDTATNMVRNLFGGVMNSVQMSGLLALAGNAFVDIPKQWDSSSVSFPTASFRIEIRHPYGNEMSAYLNVYPVVAALLAGALPISTGPQSYTSPNVCECYCQGLSAIRLGMITDLSITSGVGNLGYTRDRRPLAFDIDFTVADLSSIMHMPISNGFNPLSPTRRVLDDDNAFLDYLSTITGVHMRDMVDPRRKLAIRLAARYQDYRSFISPSHIAARISNIGGIMALNKVLGSSTLAGT